MENDVTNATKEVKFFENQDSHSFNTYLLHVYYLSDITATNKQKSFLSWNLHFSRGGQKISFLVINANDSNKAGNEKEYIGGDGDKKRWKFFRGMQVFKYKEFESFQDH